MSEKTRLGIPFFDEKFGGIHRNRQVLCIGRHGSGKSIAGLHAILQCVRDGERGLLLSTWRSQDLIQVAETMGLPLASAVAARQILLLDYAEFMPNHDVEKSLTLPPESFMELQDIVESNDIRRVVLDPVLPWVAIQPEDKVAKHVYSFVHAVERLGVTAVFTLPKPVSAIAFALKNSLVQQVPVVFTLEVDDAGNRALQANKYLGQILLPPKMPFVIAAGYGLTGTARTKQLDFPKPLTFPATDAAPVAPPAVAPVTAPAPVRLSAAPVRLAAAVAAPPPPAPAATQPPSPTEPDPAPAAEPKKPIRFASAGRQETPPASDAPIKFSSAFKR